MLLDKGAEVVDDCGEVQFRRRRCHSLQNHKMSIQILLSLRERLKEVKLWKVKSPTATPFCVWQYCKWHSLLSQAGHGVHCSEGSSGLRKKSTIANVLSTPHRTPKSRNRAP